MNKKYTGYVLVVLAIAIVVFQYIKYRVAPDFNLESLKLETTEGKPYQVSFNDDKIIVVSFFTTWCGTCHQEFKEIQGTKLKNQLNNFKFIAISDESIEKLNHYNNNYNYQYIDFVHITQNVSEIGVHAFPTIYIFDNKGKLLYSKVGLVNWNDEKWLAQFKA